MQPVDVTKEPRHEGRCRALVDRVWCSGLEQPAPLQDGKAVAEIERFLSIVGNNECCRPDVAQDCKGLVSHRFTQAHVETGKWFVEQQDSWFRRQGPRQGNTLLFTTRQHVRVLLRVAVEADHVEKISDGGLRLPAPAQAERDVVGHTEMGEQGEFLEDKAHTPKLGRPVDAVSGDHFITNTDLAGREGFESGSKVQGCGLAASRGADQAHDLAIGNLEIDILEGFFTGPGMTDTVKGQSGHETSAC